MPKLKPGTIIPSAEEDKLITQHAKEDDSLFTDEQLKTMKPLSEFPELKGLSKRGRPPKENPKMSTTLRLDAEVLEYFKADGKGWQTKINKALLEYIREHQQ